MNLLDERVTHLTTGECYGIRRVKGEDEVKVRDIVSLPLVNKGYDSNDIYRGILWGYIHAIFINGDLENGRYDAFNDAEMFSKLLEQERHGNHTGAT